MSFSLQCNKIIDDYLLNKNIIFKNRNILSLLVALLGAEYIKLSNITIINKFIVPICLYVIVMLLLEILITMVLSNKDRKELKEKCMLWINDPENKKKRIDNKFMILDMNEIKNYVKTVESFENEDDNKVKKVLKTTENTMRNTIRNTMRNNMNNK